MIDLTSALAAIPIQPRHVFDDLTGSGWTDDQLRRLLDKITTYKIVRKSSGPVYNLDTCPFCGESEGNPAAWLSHSGPAFKCHRANKCGHRNFNDLEALANKSGLPRISALDLAMKYTQQRPSVVNELFRRGDIANLIGGPKARKSFLVMLLALCVASGRPFFGWSTVKGRVLLIDNELRGDDLVRRMKAMAKAMGLQWEDVAKNIDIMPLRGSLADLTAISEELRKLPPETYLLVIIDALYKCLPAGTDENSNSDMTRAYVLLDKAAEQHNCAMVVVHHTSKGSQREKSVSDMGSGAGAQSRSADVHVVLREHEDKDTVVLQAIVRSQRPVDPICLSFEYPLWHLAPEKNPANTAIANRKPAPTLDEFVASLPTEPGTKSEVLASSKLKLGCSKDTVKALVNEAERRKLIEVIVPTKKTLPHMIRRK